MADRKNNGWNPEAYSRFRGLRLRPAVDLLARHFSQSTFARPILVALDEDEQQALITAYEAVVGKAYPKAADGSVLFPFRRLFFTLTLH